MWKLKESDSVKEFELRKGGNHKLLARLLSQNPVEAQEMDNFLSTDYQNLTHPFELNDVEKAARIFIKHAKNKSRVGIIGDYDCDGITSTTMLFELCRNFGLKAIPFLPSRLEHGYGLNPTTIESFKEKAVTPPELLFVTDCGTSNRKEIEQLKEFGIEEIIIIDHHLPYADESVVSHNADALISWHFSDGFNEQCAAGEVFTFIRGIRHLTKHVNPIEFLSYAAIGTLADSQPIVGDNRIIVKNGLTKYAFDHVLASGLNALIKAKIKYCETITQTDIEYRIAPMINAAGRIETPDVVFRLLTECDPHLADEMSIKVVELNEQRKHLQSFVEGDAVEKAKALNAKNGVFVAGENYHIGIVGIVASRVVEETGKPTLIIGHHNGVWKGSGRSIPDVNLKEILDTCSFMFEKYGGHSAAVGVTMKPEYLDKAQEVFDKACEEYYARNEVNGEFVRFFNGSLKFKAVTEEMASVLRDNLSPYCKEHNPEPIFELKNVKITQSNLKEGKGWRILEFSVYKDEEILSPQFKWFSPKFDLSIENEVVNIYFTFPQHWDNTKRFEKFDLTVVDIQKIS
jgi:single-stranded-DNA-specific exonuclease